MALLSASLGLVVGPLTDRFGFRWPLVIGLLAIATGLIGTGLAMAFPVLLGLGVLMGLGDALVYSLPFAIAATRFRGAEQRQAIGWTMGALSIAPLVGVPVLTALGGLSSWRVALVLAGLVAVGAAWLAATVLPADSGRARTVFRLGSLRQAYAPLLRHAPTLRLYAVSALRGLWWLGLLTYLGAFLGTVVASQPATGRARLRPGRRGLCDRQHDGDGAPGPSPGAHTRLHLDVDLRGAGRPDADALGTQWSLCPSSWEPVWPRQSAAPGWCRSWRPRVRPAPGRRCCSTARSSISARPAAPS